MSKKILDAADNAIWGMISAMEPMGEYGIIVKTTDDWAFPLPEDITAKPEMVLFLAGWSRENTYLDGNKLIVNVAFGEEENSKIFTVDDIYGISDEHNHVVIAKGFTRKKEEPIRDDYTLMGLIKEDDSDEVKHSMNKMLENNKDKLGKGKSE